MAIHPREWLIGDVSVGVWSHVSLGYAPENLPFARGHIPTLERGAGAHRDIW